MTGGSRFPKFTLAAGILCFIAGGPLFMTACPEPGSIDELSDAGPFIVRLELVAGPELPNGAEALVADISSIDVHISGGWVELSNFEGQVAVATNETKVIARFVLPADQAKIQSFRVNGEFSLHTPDEELRVTPERGVQINLSNQKFQAGAVNHVRVDLADAFSNPGPHGWTLDGTLAAELEVDQDSFASAEATPDGGASLVLDDGFEINIPPGALDNPQIVYVERVASPDGVYYLAEPDGIQFNVPITVKYPPNGQFEEAAISWDAELIAGIHDELGRVVVENDHFSCLDGPDIDKEIIDLQKDAVKLYQGICCGNQYSVLLVDVGNPQVYLEPVLSARVTKPSFEVKPDCIGKDLYSATTVKNLLTAARTSVEGYVAIAALNGDNAGNADGDPVYPDAICFRDLTRADGVQFHGKDTTHNRYGIEFDVNQHGDTYFKVKQGTPWMLSNAFTSGARTLDATNVDNVGFANNKDIMGPSSRASYGFSEDKRYLIMASANRDGIGEFDGMDLDLWRNLLKRSRSLANNEVVLYDLYRADEGLTPEFAYYKDGASTPENGWGSMLYGWGEWTKVRGTNLALGVFWRNAPQLQQCANGDAPRYGDVKANDWFHDPVVKLMCHGSLDNAVKYRPLAKTNRAEYLKALLELAYPAHQFKQSDAANFKKYDDVSPNDWFAPYVKFASQLTNGDEITGVGPEYRPGDDITRAEAAMMTVLVGGEKRFAAISDYFNKCKSGNKSCKQKEYSDVVLNDETPYYWHIQALSNFDGGYGNNDEGNGVIDAIICGIAGGNTFAPGGQLKRAEMAKILCRASGYCNDVMCD